MKRNNISFRGYEYLPENIAKSIFELVEKTSGNKNVRHDNFITIVGTIYFKCNFGSTTLHSYPLAKNYWKKVVGGRYKQYLEELIDAGIIDEDVKRGRKRYSTNLDMELSSNNIIRVDFKSKKTKDVGYSNYHIDRIENRLGKRIIRHLNKVSIDLEEFKFL